MFSGYKTFIVALVSVIGGAATALGYGIPEDLLLQISDSLTTLVGGGMVLYGAVMWVLRKISSEPLFNGKSHGQVLVDLLAMLGRLLSKGGGSQGGFVRLKLLPVLIVLGLAAGCVTGCATTPQSDTQRVYVAQQSLIVADTGIVEAHDAGLLTGDRYEKAKALAKAAREVYKDARDAAMRGDHDSVVTLLTTLNSTLDEIATYNGGKR